MLCRCYLPGNPGRRSLFRRGVAAVEFAVILPFLGVLVLGIVELSRAINVRQVLNDAVRKGCRTGALPNRTSAAITSDINDILTDNSINTSYATITIAVNGNAVDASTAVRGNQISVMVSVPYSGVAWSPAVWLTGGTTISSSLVMQRQG